MTALATLDDLEVVLGYTPEDALRAGRLIEMASATVERWCGRAFTYTEDDSVQVKVGRAGALLIPSPPIVEVTSVTDQNGDDIDPDGWEVHGDRLERTEGVWWPGRYTVVVSHGYDPIPDDVIKAVCELVEIDLGGVGAGYQSESLGDWAGTVKDNAIADVLASLRPYKRLVGRVEVLT